ncbi:MAG: hypothetical protein MR916_02110 [Eubacterium sp.]|nr:hypothetical protein [Eubacterium sp.]
MEDEQIIRLYFDRNETAISETDKKYGSLPTRAAISKWITKSSSPK